MNDRVMQARLRALKKEVMCPELSRPAVNCMRARDVLRAPESIETLLVRAAEAKEGSVVLVRLPR